LIHQHGELIGRDTTDPLDIGLTDADLHQLADAMDEQSQTPKR